MVAATLTAGHVPDYVMRMIFEQTALSTKIDKLNKFRLSDTCKALPLRDASLLLFQAQAMTQYSDILTARIINAIDDMVSAGDATPIQEDAAPTPERSKAEAEVLKSFDEFMDYMNKKRM
jgi:hypothetical protein